MACDISRQDYRFCVSASSFIHGVSTEILYIPQKKYRDVLYSIHRLLLCRHMPRECPFGIGLAVHFLLFFCLHDVVCKTKVEEVGEGKTILLLLCFVATVP